MRAWKIGRLAGIDISIHWTFLLLVAWVAMSSPAGGALGSVVLLLAVFGCVLLHELGHALAARQFGIGTSGITLLPIGGVASLERMPRRPTQELWIAVAGPLVNVAIAGGLFLLLTPLGALASGGLTSVGLLGILNQLMWINVGLVVFNMLPAFPMDGGRVLRASLALFIPYVNATNTAAMVGKVMALLLGIVGLFSGHLMLVFIAGFIALAGSAEARMVAAEHQQGHGMRTPFGLPQGEPVRASVVVWDEQTQRYRELNPSAYTR